MNPPFSTNPSHQRYYLIDGVRTICALMIVLYHYRDLLWSSAANQYGVAEDAAQDMVFFRYIGWIFEYGNFAVMLFWSISGFIFAHMYASRRSISGRKFFVLRFSRLYPLHFITLIYVACLIIIAKYIVNTEITHASQKPFDFITNLFFIQSWGFGSLLSFNTPTWSVSVEIAVYIAFFFVLKYLGITLLTTLMATAACAVLMVLTKNLIPACGFYFFLSAAVWVVLQKIEKMTAKKRMTYIIVLLLASFIPLAVHVIVNMKMPLTLRFAPICAVFLLLLALIEHRLPDEPKFLEPIGDITYSTYLIHIPMQMTLLLAMGAGWVSPGILLNSMTPLVYVLLVIVLGHFVYRHFEYPAQKYLRNLL